MQYALAEIRRIASQDLSRTAALLVRWTFALCFVDFGLAHLTGIHAVATIGPEVDAFGSRLLDGLHRD
jgi:hypothetical protein